LLTGNLDKNNKILKELIMARRIVVRNRQRRNKRKRPGPQVDSEKREEEYCTASIDRIHLNSFC
jgi:hypothetical protein